MVMHIVVAEASKLLVVIAESVNFAAINILITAT